MVKVEITNEATQEECLLDVLLSKVGIRRLRTSNVKNSMYEKG